MRHVLAKTEEIAGRTAGDGRLIRAGDEETDLLRRGGEGVERFSEGHGFKVYRRSVILPAVDIRVDSWAALQEELFAGSWNAGMLRHRSGFVFRGVPHVTHALESSLQTGGFANHERRLLTSFRKYASRNAVPGDSVWNWLSLAKHHGLPTRLLDWSYSPYVALHFATHNLNDFDRDGAIWCVDFGKTNDLLPQPLKKILEDEE